MHKGPEILAPTLETRIKTQAPWSCFRFRWLAGCLRVHSSLNVLLGLGPGSSPSWPWSTALRTYLVDAIAYPALGVCLEGPCQYSLPPDQRIPSAQSAPCVLSLPRQAPACR